MGYTHGLGDAQERIALEWDAQNDWAYEVKIKCPKCKKTEFVEKEEWEDVDCDEYGVETEFTCWCEHCEHEFTYSHYTHMT